MKRKETVPGGFLVKGDGSPRGSGRAHNPLVRPCRDCDADTMARCPTKGTPMCSVCQHLAKTRGFYDEPITQPPPDFDSNLKVG